MKHFTYARNVRNQEVKYCFTALYLFFYNSWVVMPVLPPCFLLPVILRLLFPCILIPQIPAVTLDQEHSASSLLNNFSIKIKLWSPATYSSSAGPQLCHRGTFQPHGSSSLPELNPCSSRFTLLLSFNSLMLMSTTHCFNNGIKNAYDFKTFLEYSWVVKSVITYKVFLLFCQMA